MLLIYAALLDAKKALADRLAKNTGWRVTTIGDSDEVLRFIKRTYNLQSCSMDPQRWMFDCNFPGHLPSAEAMKEFYRFISERKYVTGKIDEGYSRRDSIEMQQDGSRAHIAYRAGSMTSCLEFSLNFEGDAHEVLDMLGKVLGVPGGCFDQRYVLDLPDALDNFPDRRKQAKIGPKVMEEVKQWW